MARGIVGARIRERRRALGIKQAELARRAGISASYLNLIEKNRRGIAGKLLQDIAAALDMRLEELDGAEERRLLATLEEVAADQRLRSYGIEAGSAGELIGRFPGWARTIGALARSQQDLAELNRALSDRLTHDPFLGEAVHRMLTHISSVRSAAEIIEGVPDLDPEQRQRFDDIVSSESRRLSDVGEALATYFDRADTTARAATPTDEVEALFEARGSRFDEIEAVLEEIPSAYDLVSARAKAHRVAGFQIEQILTEAQQVETEAAKALARERLFAYAADVLMAPADRFRATAIEAGFDIDRISSELGLSIDLVCRRLTSLRSGGQVPRFGYVAVNAAGAVVELRPLPGFTPARYGSGCPIWALFRAQQTPGRVIRQRVQLPSGSEFLFVARAAPSQEIFFGESLHLRTDMLVLGAAHAKATVYGADLAALALDEVGVTCRICPHEDCMHRIADPLGV